MRRGVVALAAVLLGVGVAQAAVDPNVQQWITDSDVAVPNDPYRGTVNIPGNGCLSPKEIAYSKAVLLPGHDAPIPTTTDHSTIENCIVALFYKELKKVYNASGTDPGPQLVSAASELMKPGAAPQWAGGR